MTKPIFIIRIPASIPKEPLIEQMDYIQRTLQDYHIVPVRESSINRVEFECYNSTNATDKDIEEIKQMVLKQFNNEQ